MLTTPMKNVFFASVFTSLGIGLLAGTIGGAYGSDVVRPWIDRHIVSSRAAAVMSAATGTPPQTAPAARVDGRRVAGSEDLVVAAVQRVSPAVVSILLSKEVGTRDFQIIDPFGDSFGEFSFPISPAPSPGTSRTEKRQIGGGTGFIISADGLIVTNRHVVSDDAAEITVVLADRRKFPAKVLARDPLIDLAILKIDARDLPTVALGDSNMLHIGETVIAIGNTLSEFPNTVTRGIVSGLARRVVAGDGNGESEVIEEAIQTDAAINPGNSGGPLINLRGEVIGVNVATSRAAEGVGFAVPINVTKQVILSVKTTGRIVRPWLGVRYIPVTEEVQERNSLSVNYGALVVRGDRRDELAVVPGGPADKAGIKEGDILLEIDGVKIDEDHTLAHEVARHKPGDVVRIAVQRQGREQTLTATLEELK